MSFPQEQHWGDAAMITKWKRLTHQPGELVKQQPVNEVHEWLLWGQERLCVRIESKVSQEKRKKYISPGE